MMKDGGQSGKKRLVLGLEAKEAALDSAAATLAAIHMAKQVGAEVMPAVGAPGGLPLDVRLPVGDILFGAAQLQVEFARQLFELNKKHSTLLRRRLSERVRAQAPTPPLHLKYSAGAPEPQKLKIRNKATLSKTFRLRADLGEVKSKIEPELVTLAAHNGSAEGTPEYPLCTFKPPLNEGVYCGYLVVESNGIHIERIPLEVTVGK
jgi:hypothetical protein